MNFNINPKTFNSTNCDTINNISHQAKKVLKTFNYENQEIVFMKEHYIADACDDIGPYHHIWTFYLFMRNSNGEIKYIRYYREYNEKVEKNKDHPYKEVSFTDFDFNIIENIIKQEQE